MLCDVPDPAFAETSKRYLARHRRARLQRPPDFTGPRLDKFRQVFLRHGLPGALLGVACLLVPDMRALLNGALSAFADQPGQYAATGALVFAALASYATLLNRRVDVAALGWIVYLLGVSLVEEWVFRLAIPYFGQAQGMSFLAVVLLSNIAFGLAHYFTLRWKWPWCVAAFFAGVALSRQMDVHFDLALVAGIHWVATFINTPRAPGVGRTPAR